MVSSDSRSQVDNKRVAANLVDLSCETHWLACHDANMPA